MAKTCEFEAGQDSVVFKTRSNGDALTIKGVHIDADNAANLAWMIQSCETLKIEIKEVG